MSGLAQVERAELAGIALRVAREAAAIAAAGWRKPKSVRMKSEIDLVTEFDLASEDAIRELLAKETPEIALVAEESGGSAGASRTWYVDPIDGTTNFAHGHPFWCVSIGLVDEGAPVVGAVVAPALVTEWVGEVGGAASRCGERCVVSAADSLEDALLATGFPYDRRTSAENNFDAFVAMKKRSRGVRRCGSAALDLCLVADGTYDGYWERKLKPWDLAAGAAMVRAAGGALSGFDGGPARVESGDLVATNGRIHDRLVRALDEARALSSARA